MWFMRRIFIIGIFLISFLINFLINLTITVVYLKYGFRYSILSNVTTQILGIFGEFLYNFEDKSVNLKW